ncbi:MAG TPA: NAD-dependent epimerase/dehydratase family protein, partial [Polyangiaceae bacterium]
MNRILVPGGTGFIGRHLVRALVARGDAVTVLSRRRDRSRGESGVNFEVWDPHHRGDWFSLMQEHQAVAHLVGEQAVGRRYTTAVMHRIVESRVESTRLLVQALAAAEPRPKVLVCASAIGYYGPRPADEALDERAAPGSDFLAELTQKWEAAANEALKFGVRVVNARFGIILGAGGGALPEMARPFRMFLGGPIGS